MMCSARVIFILAHIIDTYSLIYYVYLATHLLRSLLTRVNGSQLAVRPEEGHCWHCVSVNVAYKQ